MSFYYHGFSHRTEHIKPSAIREALKIIAQPDIISFAGGLPAAELFPREDIAEICARILADPTMGAGALQYNLTEGYPQLRQWIVEDLARDNIVAHESNVLITTGSQQSLDLIGKIFLNPGDKVVVENPTYVGALQAFSAYQAQYLTVPSDDEGMRVDQLENILKNYKPKLIYLVPNFGNPTGVTMTRYRREILHQLAYQYQVPIVEDDPYGETRYSGDRVPPIKSLGNGQGVILQRSFSKTIAPGFRIGYTVAPTEVINKLVAAKQSVDLQSNTFGQVVLSEYLRTGKLEAHIKEICKVYAHRRDVMLDALQKYFPKDAHWTRPDGGLFIWVTLPEGMSTLALLQEAVYQKVAFIPGNAFFANGGGENTMRLNFSCASDEMLVEGIKRLGAVLKHQTPAFPTALPAFLI